MEPRRTEQGGPVRTWAAALGLAVLNVAVRFPALLNAGSVHSDAAVVGLQARAFLRGETARFLWGAGYQGTLDVWLAAQAFRFLGDSPLTLMLVPVVGHLLATTLAFFTLLRLFRDEGTAHARARAFLLCLPLVFTGMAVNGVVLYAPRQWAVTCVFLAVALLAAPQRTFSPLRLLAGGALVGVAHYLDLFVLQFAPAFLVLAAAAAFDGERTRRAVLSRLGAAAAGLGLGAAAYAWLRAAPGASASQAHSTFKYVSRNLGLMLDQALPGVLGAKVWGSQDAVPWEPPVAFEVVMWAGPALALLLVALAVPLTFSRRLGWPLRRTGLFAVLVMGASLAGYLLSPRPEDMWSMRYLAPLVWMMPFGLAPAAARLRGRGLVVLLAPYLLSNAVGGWLVLRPFVDGAVPRVDARTLHVDESLLGDALRARGVEAAMAQYWLAYRLAFLWNAPPAMVPTSIDDERYPPWREAFDHAKTVAIVWHPAYPQFTLDEAMTWARSQGAVERFEVAGFTVLLIRRPP